MSLETYKRKRAFDQTPEPEGKEVKTGQHRFVVQEHHASRLHFDFRLEIGGVLKSWAVPKGPSLNPADKRLAVMTEDHPVQYLTFEGRIAEGNYGAGEMVVWDHGTFELLEPSDALAGVEKGQFSFRLQGAKLRGVFTLRRFRGADNQWLLIKGSDEHAGANWQLETILPGEIPQSKPRAAKKVKARDSQEKSDSAQSRKSSELLTQKPLSIILRRTSKVDDVLAEVDGTTVPLNNLNKVFWPDEGYTKRDLLRYYDAVAETILPYLENRPLILKRYPGGITGHSFFQHEVKDAPESVTTTEIENANEQGETLRYAMANNRQTLLWVASIASIAFSPWHSKITDLEHPTWLVFDLDPEEGGFAQACDVALLIRDLLQTVNLTCYPKTSGASGLHVYVPLGGEATYEEAANFAEATSKVIAKQHPEIATVERSLKKRPAGVVYVDHLQNALGKTVVAPYSVRARAGATVSTPLTWEEVESHPNPQSYTIETVPQRLKKHGDLFVPVLHEKQLLNSATEEIKRLGRKRKPA